jgi:methylmalonyl-CoA/ethylmalonyl-CoA epimerase
MRLHHYGFATKSIDDSALSFEKLGYVRTTMCVEDLIQNVRILFLKKEGCHLLELIEPLSEHSPVTKIIKNNNASLYHICYEVDSITDSICELRKAGFALIMNPLPAIALNNRLVCFLYNSHTGLIELLNKKT